MGLPYENSTSGKNAIADIQKILQGFGASSFGYMEQFDTDELLVQFDWNGRKVQLKASARGYAAAWLKHHPYSTRSRGNRSDHEAKALKQGKIAVYSILRDWVKGQVTAIETGMLTFEGAFLGQLLLDDNTTVLEKFHSQLSLPAPVDE